MLLLDYILMTGTCGVVLQPNRELEDELAEGWYMTDPLTRQLRQCQWTS